MTGPEKNFHPLIRRLRSLPETSMRREVLAEQILSFDPVQALRFFSTVADGASRRSAAHLVAMEALHEMILHGQNQGPLYELLAEVYRLAREEDNQAVLRMLMIAQPSRGPLGPAEVPGDQEMSRLTLGERKYLARGHDRIRLDRLLYDPDPSVVRNLLANPHLTEQDVVRLAARRPTQVEIQREIFESRWGERYRVRMALASNPFTPTDLSLKLTIFLLVKELRCVATDRNLHQLVRDEAQRLLQQRTRKKTR